MALACSFFECRNTYTFWWRSEPKGQGEGEGATALVAIPIPSGEGQNWQIIKFLIMHSFVRQSQYLYLLVKVRTRRSPLPTPPHHPRSQYLYLLVKVRTVKEEEDLKSSLEVKSRNTYTFWWRSEQVEYNIPTTFLIGVACRNTYTFWWRSELVSDLLSDGTISMSQYLYLLVKVRTFNSSILDGIYFLESSQYLYLLVKVRTNKIYFIKSSGN